MQVWMQDQVQVIVATNAWNESTKLLRPLYTFNYLKTENYYQEGRAGRNDEKAFAVLCIVHRIESSREPIYKHTS
jgi:superfamily II DNA helicase RecQ